MAYQFRSLAKSRIRRESPAGPESPAAGAAQPGDGAAQPTTQTILGNLLAHVPTEAVALSTSLSPLTTSEGASDTLVRSWVLFVGSFVLMIVVRLVNKASLGVWITSLIAFFLYMALVPTGALQGTFPILEKDPVITLMIAAIFSAVVTVLASKGIIK
jgi:hypothetical protein